MVEPGLDRHEWETEWQALEPLVVDSPAEALPEVDRLVGRMLAERAPNSATADFLHGPIALLGLGLPVVAIAPAAAPFDDLPKVLGLS